MYETTALITGSASGIGKAIAIRLHADGYKCVLVDVDRENGMALANSLGNAATFCCCDISNQHEVEQLFQQGYSIDVLINNAGIIRDNMIWNMPVAEFDAVLDINLRGTWMMCREAAKMMRERKAGRIVNIASRAWLGNAGQSNYAASKGGVISLTRVLALELGRYGITVNAVAPGLIDTALTKGLSDEVRSKLIQAQPTRSMGTPEDVAHTVSFLCNENTRFITGQTIYVDGGKSIGAGL